MAKIEENELLNKFGEIMDSFLKEAPISIVVYSEEESDKWEIECNVDSLGPVVQFYILLKALPLVFDQFKDILDENLTESFVDETLKLVKADIMEAIGKEAADA